MGLASGTRIGHYDITALLGEGGMGQVWQATDTQLNREVALKILPEAFAADPDRLARFQREASEPEALRSLGIWAPQNQLGRAQQRPSMGLLALRAREGGQGLYDLVPDDRIGFTGHSRSRDLADPPPLSPSFSV